jgi:hypothetical protein
MRQNREKTGESRADCRRAQAIRVFLSGKWDFGVDIWGGGGEPCLVARGSWSIAAAEGTEVGNPKF